MSDKTYMILGLVYLSITIVLIVVVLLLINKHNKKKFGTILSELERDKNLVLSGAILVELNKVASLINNKDLEKKYHLWQGRYKTIRDTDIPDLDDKLNELETLIKTRKNRRIYEAIAKLELQLYYVKTKSEFLLNEIKEISLSESKNREIVTKLKREYREIHVKYNENINNYELIKVPIELQFENIDKLFGAFEVSIEQNAYQEVGKIVKALDDTIGNIKIVIDESPMIILMGKKLIPSKIDDIVSITDKMAKEGYNLEYLNIDYNIGESNKKIADIFDRLNVLNLTDSVFELKTILNYFESLYADFDNEKRAKQSFEEYYRKVAIKCKNLLKIITNISSKIEDIKYSYDLTEDEVKIIDELNLNVKAIQNDYEIIVENFRNRTFPYSKLSKELELLNMRLTKNEDKLEITLKNLGSLKEDEERAREQLGEIRGILQDTKSKINSYKLPIIPENYFVELSEATDALNIMIDELNKKPISIKVLNLRVDTARDLVLKVFKTSTQTIKNAKIAENIIVYGNRFKPLNEQIEIGLNKAQKQFFNGEYRESLETAVNSISIYDSSIHKRLNEIYKNKMS